MLTLILSALAVPALVAACVFLGWRAHQIAQDNGWAE
jgi:hypothetical protein